jgi:FkbM family methyltransferase
MNKLTSGEEYRAAAQLQAANSVESLRRDLLATVPQLSEGRLDRLAIVGAGPEGLRLAQTCRAAGIDIAGVYDGNARKRGTKFAGHTVYPAEALTRLAKDVPIIVASHRVLGSCESLRALGYVAVPLAWLQVGMPERFPPHSFYERLLEDLFEHRNEYLSLFDVFVDETSRRVLDAVIAYRLSLDPLRLRNVIDWDLYGAVEFGQDEVYVDGGTYTGDSIQLFSEHVGGRYSKIYGFEPDAGTFDVLQERFGKTPNVELHNCGLFSKSGTLGFSADSSRAAKIDEHSETRIKVTRLDDVVNDRVSFIKMNIEGAELDALDGSRRTIATWAPKLAISAYHRASDLRNLCTLIRKLNDKYRLSLRQHDGGIIETVVYATA